VLTKHDAANVGFIYWQLLSEIEDASTQVDSEDFNRCILGAIKSYIHESIASLPRRATPVFTSSSHVCLQYERTFG
jgi:hypothetical protein